MSGEGDSKKQGTMEGISDLLRCYICMERLSNATVCPHCSKLCCFECIRRWVTDNRSNCPICRNALTLHDLIKIPLFDDLGQVLDNLHAVKKEVVIASDEQEKCSTHHEKMSVYCETCKTSICHECALWSKEHKQHTFKPLDLIFKRNTQILQGELTNLKERMKVIFSQVQQVEKKMEGVKVNKSKTKKELAHAVEKMSQQLDDTAKGRITTLNEFRHYLRSQALEITKESHDLEKTIAGGNISSLIDSNGDLKPEISATIKKLLTPSHQIEDLPKLSHFVNEVVPEYDSAIFKISSFGEKQRKGEEVYSDPLVVQGLVWRLKVYPNGHKEEMGNYLAVFVELAEGYSAVANYQYGIEMLYACTNKSPHRNHLKEYSSEFADGESWGYRKYYELSRLQTDGFLRDDTVVLKFSVRAPTYYQKFNDQFHYLKKVGKERDALKQQLEAAKQQISTLKVDYKSLLAERHHAASSHNVPTQHSGHTSQGLPLHSSQQPHPQLPQHRSSSSHHHHHSGPHGHQRRDRSNRLDPEDARGYISQPITQHRSPSHSMHSSQKQSPRYPPTHGEARMVGEPFQHSPRHVYQRRRRSSEESADLRKFNQEKRRASAETAQPHDQDPRVYRGQHAQNLIGKSTAEVRFVETSTSSEDLEASSSQQWEDSTTATVNAAYITITSEDEEGSKNRSTSSGSTLIEADSPPPRGPKKVGNKQDLSQELFGDEDSKEMMSMSELPPGPTVPIPLSNFPHYYESSGYFGDQQESYPQPAPPSSKHEQTAAHLSQPNSFLSPPKSRYGKSLTDLTGSNISLTSSQQLLSQSAVDIQHMHDLQRYPDTSRQRSEGRHKHEHRFRAPHSQLQRMASDSHLNKSHIPGLQVSIISALCDVTEEQEQRRQQAKEKRRLPHAASQQTSRTVQHCTPQKNPQLQQRHVKATVLRGNVEASSSPNNKKRESENQKPRNKNGDVQQQNQQPEMQQQQPETQPTMEQQPIPLLEVGKKNPVKRSITQRLSPTTVSRNLGSTKSNSTSSLSQIL